MTVSETPATPAPDPGRPPDGRQRHPGASGPEAGGVRPLRKLLHAGLSLGAAGVVAWLPPLEAAVVLAGATTAALTVELLRRVQPAVSRAFQGLLAGLLKGRERARLTGATTLSLGFTVAALLFPGTPALAGILFAGLGDPAASLAGRKTRKFRYPGGKSVAGSTALGVVVFGTGLLLGLGVAPALFAAVLLAAVEAFSLPADDNLYLPLTGAAGVVLGRMLFGV